MWDSKARRSLDRSPRLFWRSFGDVQPIFTPRGERGAFRFDLESFNRVMRAIASGLYFNDYGTRHEREWGIFSSTLLHAPSLYAGRPDPWQAFRDLVSRAAFVPRQSNHPWIFDSAVFDPDRGPAYRLRFYAGFTVYALSLRRTPGVRSQNRRGTQLEQNRNVF